MASNTLELLIEYKNGNTEVKDIIVNQNLSLVWALVHRFNSAQYDKEDLFQIGCVGLLKAIDNYDSSFQTQFSTYAVPIILGEIKRFFRDDGAIKVSRSLKELNIKIGKVRGDLYDKYGKEPSIEEIALFLNVSCEDVVMALESSVYPASLSEPYLQKDGSKTYLESRIAQEETININDLLSLKEGIKKLDEKEKLLIYLRYYKDMNQSEIALRFNISQVQVSRMEKKIIEKLRTQFV